MATVTITGVDENGNTAIVTITISTPPPGPVNPPVIT